MGGRKASSHRCSQAAVRRTSTSPLNEDTLPEPENTMIAHILRFSKYTVHLKETHPSAFTGTSSLYQVSLVAPGSELKEGRGNFVFQHGPETADGCTS